MRAIATGVVIGALLASAVVGPVSRAQPAAPEKARAKDLYRAATTAMQEGRFADAIRDFGAAYDLTRDPVLFYKIGVANEKAGKCDVALIYFGRYLREARPTPEFVELTRARVLACGGDARSLSVVRPIEPEPPAGGSGPVDVGSAAAGSDAGADAGADGSSSGVTGLAGSGSGSAAPVVVGGRHRAAWLLVAGSVGLVTIGAVLAYSANSAESDIDDLYVGLANRPPEFDAKTAATYQALLDEGNRYEKLSWVAFGLAGATAVTAAVLFYRADPKRERVQVAPTVTREGGGVSAIVRW